MNCLMMKLHSLCCCDHDKNDGVVMLLMVMVIKLQIYVLLMVMKLQIYVFLCYCFFYDDETPLIYVFKMESINNIIK